MQIFKTPAELQRYALELKRNGVRIGLVPTMGALHCGHASLIDIAVKNCDKVIVSVFLNPKQFGPSEDLSRYPRTFDADVELCRSHGAAAVFAPQPESMYCSDASTYVVEDAVSRPLCGARRPGHFRGVATVVAKLFNLALPDIAVFGMKDAQQLQVLRRMVRDLNFPVRIIPAPLVRGEDGLAVSSRNVYLNDDEHRRALVLHRSLEYGGDELSSAGIGAIPRITAEMKNMIAVAGGEVDYVEALDFSTLEPADASSSEILIAVAAYFGKTRLIDNTLIKIIT